MCGILGSLGPVDQDTFAKCLNRLQHRGPDGFGLWQDGELTTLGHRRLAILDLSDAGKQPMSFDDLTITFNGEIYNYKELRSELEAHGHHFLTATDTEVIIQAYRHWGPKCLQKFNGMWAFAIWDKVKRELFISRDRFGVKPLFFSFTSDAFIFGSEMKAIAPLLPEIALSNDFAWCRDNIYAYETSDKSLLKGIQRFPAGSFAVVKPSDRKLAVTKFWNTLDHIRDVDEQYDKQVERFRELFFDACKLRMRSDVKIGTALSGGLDSSSVAAAMHNISKSRSSDVQGVDWQNAFVATFPGTELDEREYAEEVIRAYYLVGHFSEIDPIECFLNLGDELWLFEELYLTSPGPMVNIYKTMKASGVSVTLDGHGADELLSGYGNMIFNAVRERPFDLRNMREVADIYRQMRGVDKTTFELVVNGFFGRKNMAKFYVNRIFGGNRDNSDLVNRLGHFNAALYEDFHRFILPTLLRNYDRYSMAAGVEVRMPFLDYRLVSFCFSIPWQSKLRDGKTKSILRDALKPYLPEKVYNRKRKTGFGTPFTSWLQGPWKSPVLNEVNSADFSNSGLIDVREARRKVEAFYALPEPSFEDGHKVWEVLMPYFWEKYFYKRLALQ
jgi:asparagine synthase (glutamine-hydrolysing)